MTKQETFDTVVRAVIAQGRASINELGTTCLYRGVGGVKCAAGHLIPDDRYKPEFEGLAIQGNLFIDENREEEAEELRDLVTSLGHDLELVQALQDAHDDAAFARDEVGELMSFVPEFRRRVKDVAVRFELSAVACEEGASC